MWPTAKIVKYAGASSARNGSRPSSQAGQWLRILRKLENRPPAPQRGTGTLLETDDDRVAGAVGLGDSITFTHSSDCTVQGATTAQSCVHIVRLTAGVAMARSITLRVLPGAPRSP